MGQVNTLYGCIFTYVGNATTLQKRSDHNSAALSLLPDRDGFPPLTRNTFAITARDYATQGMYKVQLIHFGASFKDLLESWDVWLMKFEALLAKMYWNKVTLHLEVEPGEVFTFFWKRESDSGLPVKNWTFEGGPRMFGSSRQRWLDWLINAEKEVGIRQHDVDFIAQLAMAYWRLGDERLARKYFEQLKSLSPEKASALAPVFMQ